MRTLSRFCIFGLFPLALVEAGINDGVGGVSVGLGKTPPGKIKALAVTDSPGAVRPSITEPGTCTIKIQNPVGTASAPAGAKALTVKLQGRASKAVGNSGVGELKFPNIDRAIGLATGRIFMSEDAQRIRVEHPGTTFSESGRSHIETIEVVEPMDLICASQTTRRTRLSPPSKSCPSTSTSSPSKADPRPSAATWSPPPRFGALRRSGSPALRVTAASTAASTGLQRDPDHSEPARRILHR
jgi:hypothetical protein